MPYRSSDPMQPTALYRLYGDSDQLLYIGITRNPKWRWYMHARRSPWWPSVQRRDLVWHDSRPEARAAEIEAIGAERPVHNKYDRGFAELAAHLTELRVEAGLSGNALARRMGIVQSRVWKIEHAQLMPGEDDIRAWARAVGRDEIAADLLGSRQAAVTGDEARRLITIATESLRGGMEG
jgi:predicted GIY-YIG superfamily endonuclease